MQPFSPKSNGNVGEQGSSVEFFVVLFRVRIEVSWSMDKVIQMLLSLMVMTWLLTSMTESGPAELHITFLYLVEFFLATAINWSVGIST